MDTDSLPPYDVLDPVIEAYVEDDLGVDEMVANGMDRALVTRVIGWSTAPSTSAARPRPA